MFPSDRVHEDVRIDEDHVPDRPVLRDSSMALRCSSHSNSRPFSRRSQALKNFLRSAAEVIFAAAFVASNPSRAISRVVVSDLVAIMRQHYTHRLRNTPPAYPSRGPRWRGGPASVRG